MILVNCYCYCCGCSTDIIENMLKMKRKQHNHLLSVKSVDMSPRNYSNPIIKKLPLKNGEIIPKIV